MSAEPQRINSPVTRRVPGDHQTNKQEYKKQPQAQSITVVVPKTQQQNNRSENKSNQTEFIRRNQIEHVVIVDDTDNGAQQPPIKQVGNIQKISSNDQPQRAPQNPTKGNNLSKPGAQTPPHHVTSHQKPPSQKSTHPKLIQHTQLNSYSNSAGLKEKNQRSEERRVGK